MPIYVGGQIIQGWNEINHSDKVSDGNENSTSITLLNTSGFYGNYWVMWSWDYRTAYPWFDMLSGVGFGYGILNGTHGSGNYVYRDIYSNSSSISSLTATGFKVTNSTGADRYLNTRTKAWSDNPTH